MTERKRKIEAVLRAVPSRCIVDHGEQHNRYCSGPDYPAMARAVVEQVVGPLATVCQRHGCMWEAHAECEDKITALEERVTALQGDAGAGKERGDG